MQKDPIMCKDPTEEMATQEGPVDFLEKERQLIAYELRENVHKTLALLRLYIRLLKPTAEDELEIKSRSLEELDQVMAEINGLSRELASPGISASPVTPNIPLRGLVESLRGLIAYIRLSKGIAIEFDNDLETYPIDVGKKLAIFRIVQAHLENILELSTPTAANIILTLVDQHVQLIIQDNGAFAGVDDARLTGRITQRMSYIRERARFYQGTSELESSKDGGRKLTVILPVRTLPGRLSLPARGR